MSISAYAKGLQPDFLIVPQNGVELAFVNQDQNDGLALDYIQAIDGVGVEELFFNGSRTTTDERLSMLRELVQSKVVLVSEFVEDDNKAAEAWLLNNQEGFLCFPRAHDNYDYALIPDTVPHEHAGDVLSLSDARNYLYLINNAQFQSKAEMLQALSQTNYDVLLLDLFFEDEAWTASEVDQLKVKANGGQRLVISYINIGSAEKFRYYWKKSWTLHHPLWVKKRYEGYDDEFWVKFWKKEWQEILYGNDDSYIKKIVDAGFHGAYLDNVEAYYFLYYND